MFGVASKCLFKQNILMITWLHRENIHPNYVISLKIGQAVKNISSYKTDSLCDFIIADLVTT